MARVQKIVENDGVIGLDDEELLPIEPFDDEDDEVEDVHAQMTLSFGLVIFVNKVCTLRKLGNFYTGVENVGNFFSLTA